EERFARPRPEQREQRLGRPGGGQVRGSRGAESGEKTREANEPRGIGKPLRAEETDGDHQRSHREPHADDEDIPRSPGREDEHEAALGEARAEIAEATEVAEHPREQQEASEPEEAHQHGHRHGAEPAAAHDVAEREKPRLEERGERHARPSPPAPRMSRKTVSTDAGAPARPSSGPARARSS